jgi:acetyl esterase/lipase
MRGRLWASGVACALALSMSMSWGQQPQGSQPPAGGDQMSPQAKPPGARTPRPLDTHGVKQKWLDVAYANGSEKQKLDIYLPDEGKGPFPVIVAVHGGGFAGGDKNTGEVNAELNGVLRGYAVASVNYRLSGEAKFPAAIFDVKAAIRFLKANASKYNLDPKRFVIWGDSAGANIGSVVATSAGVKDMEDLSMGNANQSSAVQVAVDYFGPTNLGDMDAAYARAGITKHMMHDLPNSSESNYMGFPVTTNPEKVKLADPTTYITSKTCPFFIANGSVDPTVPPQQNADFAAALEKAIGKDNVIHIQFDGVGHGGEIFSAPETLNKVFAFLDKYLKK